MKTRIFLLLLSALQAVLGSDPSIRVERGLNIVKTWQSRSPVSEFKQVLSQFTNMLQVEKYWQISGEWTQKVYTAHYQGNGAMKLVDGTSVEFRDSGSVTNIMDPEDGYWSTFHSGGSQGAMTVVNGDERTQIINAAWMRLVWNTNGGYSWYCREEDDQYTCIFWFRTNTVQTGLPWFIGNQMVIHPGESKPVAFATPVDCIWKFIGIDKCFKCGESCWLAGWPEPAAKPSSLTTSSYGNSLHLSFSGTAGSTYALQQSPNLRDWSVRQIAETDDQGGVDYIISSPAGPCFFRVQAVSTSTMNEEETRLAVEEIRAFNQTNP